MKHIFYFFTFIAILWEMLSVINPKSVHDFYKRVLVAKGKKFRELSTSQQTISVCMLGYMIWNFIGFFTFQWPIFIMLFLIGLIPKKWILLRWIDAFISLLILLFIVLNAYHLKIDLFELIKSYIS
jgi:hypothetical protein